MGGVHGGRGGVGAWRRDILASIESEVISTPVITFLCFSVHCHIE